MEFRQINQFAHQVAELMVSETWGTQINPLEDIAGTMTDQEFQVFCQLVTTEVQQMLARQIRQWQQEVVSAPQLQTAA
ncbi:hypothetical protein IQ266_08905 [filamentous cyanobacterium LEGE 11480]|uniref:Uncharacterized protein n=1 Tax=Romeriopsis navalis LEGE 11480 TaxID=2777977 RepID=A0A928VNB1_9CYAN|nr:hypothetical protein [Romeriopsis navalis]MBE9029846.1 hypothetical protein [Romeriopsis navalis LEGE 11480]